MSKPTDFGTPERSVIVQAKQLEVGVKISGHRFGTMHMLVVQDVSEPNEKQAVRVDAADFDNGDHLTRWFYSHAPFTTWGKL